MVARMCTKNDSPEYYFRDLLAATVQFLLVALILLGGKTVPVYASVSDTCASGLDPTEVFWPDAPAVIPFKGADSQDPLAFRHYNASEEVLGRTMKDWLRFSVAFWHSIRNDGSDPFGFPTKRWPWDAAPAGCEDPPPPMELAKRRMRAMFELMRKLGVDLWCFHDRDIAPRGDTLEETNANLDEIVEYAAQLQEGTEIRPLWGTAQLFAEPHYMHGAATSPSVDVFVRAAAQVKKAMDATRRLGGENFNFWGGREGYAFLPTTDLKTEREHAAMFFKMARDYWVKDLKQKGKPLLIEPKPQEPSKHQYDWDVGTTAGFLREFHLEKDFRLNVECNHATLAGHSCSHEIETAVAMDMLGGLDANTGDPQVGWDTDQFMTDGREAALVLSAIVRSNGFAPGGINFDAKTRRESTDVNDLLYAHIGGMDAMAKGLKLAAELVDPDGALEGVKRERYSSWVSELGVKIETGKATLKELEKLALEADGEPVVGSGKQELADNIIAAVVG